MRADVLPGPSKSQNQPTIVEVGAGQTNPAPLAMAGTRSEAAAVPLSWSTTDGNPPRPSVGASGAAIARYQYHHPVPGPAGDRARAESLFREGLKWHRSGRQALGIERYQAAAEADPSYFEPYFNMGVAAYETADWQLCLVSYEMAMALNPERSEEHTSELQSR